eukprot:scaffold14371_cov40-Attheya_sp.AAC.1
MKKSESKSSNNASSRVFSFERVRERECCINQSRERAHIEASNQKRMVRDNKSDGAREREREDSASG